MSSNTLAIQLRHHSDELITWTHRAVASDTLVVCFSGIGPSMEHPAPYQFAKTATQNGTHNALFISDPQCTWLNGPGLIEMITHQIELYRSECDATRVLTAGHSMGGFSALVMPAFTQVNTVLALAPQISVHPKIVPNEKRWHALREKISDFRIRSAADYLTDTSQYTVVFGRHPRDAPQRDRVPNRGNLRVYVMLRTHHNVPQRLKRMNLLDKVFQFAIEGKPRKLRLLLKSQASAVILPKNDTSVSDRTANSSSAS